MVANCEQSQRECFVLSDQHPQTWAHVEELNLLAKWRYAPAARLRGRRSRRPHGV